MNELIKQIAIEAKVEHCISHVRLNDFANLILENVMSICEDLGDKGMDGHYCVDAIKTKFELWPMPLNTEENT